MKHIVCAKHCTEGFLYISLSNLHNTPGRQVVLLCRQDSFHQKRRNTHLQLIQAKKEDSLPCVSGKSWLASPRRAQKLSTTTGFSWLYSSGERSRCVAKKPLQQGPGHPHSRKAMERKWFTEALRRTPLDWLGSHDLPPANRCSGDGCTDWLKPRSHARTHRAREWNRASEWARPGCPKAEAG